MSKKILQQSTRHKETRREHGAESGSNDDNDIPHSSSRSKSVPALHAKKTKRHNQPHPKERNTSNSKTP